MNTDDDAAVGWKQLGGLWHGHHVGVAEGGFGRGAFDGRADHKRETDGAGGQEKTPDQAGDEDGVDERKGFGPGLLVALDPGREPDEIAVCEEPSDQQEQAEGHRPEHGPPVHRHEATNATTKRDGQDHDR